MFILWKDHTAVEEAAVINDTPKSGTTDYTMYQGEYSAEWFWRRFCTLSAEILEKYGKMHTWAEHADWISCLLAGRSGPRNLSAVPLQVTRPLWNSNFGGLPFREILFYRWLSRKVYDSYKTPGLGHLWEQFQRMGGKTRCQENAVISVGSFDAHAGGVGAGIAPGTMVKVIGTSTVDLLIEKRKT